MVRRVTSAGVPVLCLDTCALLDVMRDPMRERFSADQTSAALDLLGRAECSPRALSIIVAEQVHAELSQIIQSIEQESAAAVRKIERALGIFGCHGLVANAAAVAAGILRFPVVSRGVVERFITASHIARPKRSLYGRAFNRISTNMRPARRGKDSAGDCLIVETYLETAGMLRTSGFKGGITFLTTNPADYAESGRRSVLHSELTAGFAAVELDYHASFLAARYGLFPYQQTAG